MDVTLIARDAQGAGLPDPRVFDSAELPASESALADLRATVGGADLAAPPVVLPGLPPQVQHGAAVLGGRRDPQLHPAHADQRVGQLRHGPDRAGLGPPGASRDRGVLPAGPRALPVPATAPPASCRPRDVLALRDRGRGLRRRAVRRRGVDPRARRGVGRPSTSTATAARTGCAASCPGSSCSWPGCGSARSARPTTSSSCRWSRRSSTRRRRRARRARRGS